VSLLTAATVATAWAAGLFPPGTRVEGSHADALLILHNLGKGAGVRANSEGGGPAIVADSSQGNGVMGRTLRADRAGVRGYSAKGNGISGRSDGNDGVVGVTGTAGKSGVWGWSNLGVGVSGSSAQANGVVGWTDSSSKSGVFGRSINGFGVTAQSKSGTALLVDGTSIFKKYASFEGGHGDLAENYLAAEPLGAGDVVMIAPGGGLTLGLSRRANDTAVAGIVSTEPSMRLSGRIASEQGVPLVIAGRTLCKVDARHEPIAPGDLLTPSATPGHAMKATPVRVGGVEIYKPGTIVGKALEGLAGQRGVINVLVTLQ